MLINAERASDATALLHAAQVLWAAAQYGDVEGEYDLRLEAIRLTEKALEYMKYWTKPRSE